MYPIISSFDTFSDLYDDDVGPIQQGVGSLFANETDDLETRVLARKPMKASQKFVARSENSELFQVKKNYRRKDLKSALETVKSTTASNKS